MDTSLPSYPETVSGICSNLCELSVKIEKLKRKVYELSIKNGFTGLNYKNTTALSHYLSELNKAILNVQTDVSNCEVLTKKCYKCFTKSIPWLPQRMKHLQVMFLDGNDPWSFWLTYQDKTEFNTLYKNLRKKHDGNCLKWFADIPEVGTFVCCVDRKSVFRGIILSHLSDGRFKIFNVDTNCVKMVKHENIFQLDNDLCQLHSFAIHCCVTQMPKGRAVWNEELSGIFKSALRECKLEINVKNEIDSLPPKFYVDLYGYNETLGVSSNLGEWICSRLLPTLENLDNNKVDVCDLSDSVLDPYFDISTNENKSVLNNGECFSQNVSVPSERLMETPHHSDVMVQTISLKENELEDDHPFSSTKVKQGHCSVHVSDDNDVNPHGLESPVNCRAEILANACIDGAPNEVVNQDNNLSDSCKFKSISIQHRRSQEVDFSGISSCKKKNCMNNNLQLKGVCNVQSKVDHSEQNLNDFDVRNVGNLSLNDPGNIIRINSKTCFNKDSELPKNQDIGLISVHHSETRKELSKNFLVEHNCDEDISINPDIETIVGGSYNVTDEMRICKFFAKKGYCWKLGCTKEHVPNIEGRWTTDKVDGFRDVFNNLLLPEPGETVDLFVTTVLSTRSFYGHLPDKYSAIDENERDNLETLVSLISSINSPSNVGKYEFLEGDPCPGELLLAYGTQNLWLRARVLDVLDKSVQVFYVDYGTTDDIYLKDNLRKIAPEFLHLPAQAVFCWLGDVYAIDDEVLCGEGLCFLEKLITKKKVKASIINRNLIESEMEVIIHTTTGTNVNEAMVKKGYCLKFYN